MIKTAFVFLVGSFTLFYLITSPVPASDDLHAEPLPVVVRRPARRH